MSCIDPKSHVFTHQAYNTAIRIVEKLNANVEKAELYIWYEKKLEYKITEKQIYGWNTPYLKQEPLYDVFSLSAVGFMFIPWDS